LLSIFELGALDIQPEHGLLGLIERLIAARIVCARVFEARTEARREERRRQLIVLGIRRIGVNGDGAVAQQ
jgi:hypothetical protein